MKQGNKSLKSFLVLIFIISAVIFPKPSRAASLTDIFTSPDSIVVKAQEGIEYFFAFRVENKVMVLEKHAEKRLVKAQTYAEEGNKERVQNMIQSYQQIKERQNNLLEKIDNGEILGMVEQRTIEQQKIMEKIKNVVDPGTKEVIKQVQEQVVNQIAERVVVVNGSQGQIEFFQKVERVWAPGTGPGGQAGTVIEGNQIKFAPGTEVSGESGVKVEGDKPGLAPGTSNSNQSEVVVEGDKPGLAPGTGEGGEGGVKVEGDKPGIKTE